MNEKFSEIKAEKDAKRRDRNIVYSLSEIKAEIETCMENEIDSNDKYPVELVNQLAELHSTLERIGVKVDI